MTGWLELEEFLRTDPRDVGCDQARTIAVLTAAPPESLVWTFSSVGDQRTGWWRRRLAVELAIHRWDAQHAADPGTAATVTPLDDNVAAAASRSS